MSYLDDIPDIGIGSRRPVKKKQRKAVAVTTAKVVIWRPVKCPECGSGRVKVYSTQPPLRYHKCHDCGARFKSVEE